MHEHDTHEEEEDEEKIRIETRIDHPGLLREREEKAEEDSAIDRQTHDPNDLRLVQGAKESGPGRDLLPERSEHRIFVRIFAQAKEQQHAEGHQKRIQPHFIPHTEDMHESREQSDTREGGQKPLPRQAGDEFKDQKPTET